MVSEEDNTQDGKRSNQTETEQEIPPWRREYLEKKKTRQVDRKKEGVEVDRKREGVDVDRKREGVEVDRNGGRQRERVWR